MRPSQMRYSMRRSRTNRLLQWVGLLAVILILSACAASKRKFVGSTRADVGVFADQTLVMMGDPEFGFSKGTEIYTKVFLDPDGAEEIRFARSMKSAERVMAAIVKYTLTILTFVETESEDEGRIRLYTQYLSSFDDKVLKALKLDDDYYEEILLDVRSQDKFMDALVAAQPLINGAGRYMDQTLIDMSENLDALEKKVDKKIDAEYADVIRYQKTLESEEYEILATLEELYLYLSRRDKEAYKRALAHGTILDKEVIPRGSSPSYAELSKVRDHLLERLDGIDRIWKIIEPDWITYRETHRELDALADMVKRQIVRVRLTTLVWVRAHMKMASGKYAPAEWFNVSEATSKLIGVGAWAAF